MTREAGVPNKNKRGLKARLREEYGKDFDVIMMMAKNAKKMHDMVPEKLTSDEDMMSAKLCNDALDKLAQYVEPKLKSIEVKAEISTRPVLVDLSGGDLTLALATDRDKDDE